MNARFSRIFKKDNFFERPQAEFSNRRIPTVYTKYAYKQRVYCCFLFINHHLKLMRNFFKHEFSENSNCESIALEISINSNGVVMMKKIALSALALFSLSVQADELSTFSDVAATVSQGKPVNFVIHFKECVSQTPLPAVTASITPNAVMVIANSRITASDRHFTLDDPSARGTPVFDYSKFNIDSEGKVSINVTIMNARNYEVLGTHAINCQLGEGFKVFR